MSAGNHPSELADTQPDAGKPTGSPSSMAAATAWLALVDAHLARRPFMQGRDVYKLIYQGVMGPGHLIASPADFAARLQVEFDSLEPAANEALTESIHPAGQLYRINLRPYKACHASPAKLVEACLATARQPWGSLAELRAVWEEILSACRSGRWPGLAAEELLAFSRWLEAQGFPAVHHSQVYRDACQPAYRLIAPATLSEMRTLCV